MNKDDANDGIAPQHYAAQRAARSDEEKLASYFPTMKQPGAPAQPSKLLVDQNPAPKPRSERTEEEKLAAWFNHPTSKMDEPPAEERPNAEDDAAKKFFPKTYAEPQEGADPDAIPDEIKELRSSDRERLQFSAQSTHGDTISADDFLGADGAEVEGVTAELRARAAHEYREMFADVGVSADEARQMVSLAKQLGAAPPTPQIEEQWQGEIVKRLLDVNNQDIDKANADLALAQRLVHRDPRIAAILEKTRLGNHPKVVELFVQRARQERLRGRLP